MIKPQPFKYKCPKCKSKMDKVKLNPIEEVFIKLTTFR